MLRHQQHLAVYRRTKEFYSWFQCSVFRHNSTERLQSSTEFYWNQSTQSEIYFDDYSLNVTLVIQKKRTVILLFRQKSQCMLSRVSTALFLTFLLGFYLDLSRNIDLVTVLVAILTSRQTRKKLQCLYENLISNNFRRTAVMKKIWFVNQSFTPKDSTTGGPDVVEALLGVNSDKRHGLEPATWEPRTSDDRQTIATN